MDSFYGLEFSNSCRGAFGEFKSRRGEPASGECVVEGCRERPSESRGSQTTTLRLCSTHAAGYDAGRVRGSFARGYREHKIES